MGIKGWVRKHPPDTDIKEIFCLIFLALPHISAVTPQAEYLSRCVAICTSQPTWKSGPQSALRGGCSSGSSILRSAQLAPSPELRGWHTGEICVRFPLLRGASSPQAAWVTKVPTALSRTLIEVAHNEAASRWGEGVTSCRVKTSAPALSISYLPHRGFFLQDNRLAELKNVI